MKWLNYILLLSVILVSCKSEKSADKSDAATDSNIEKVEKAIAVSIYDKVPLRKEPVKKDGTWLGQTSLGETMTYLGVTAIDSTDNNREYLKVELSDGTVAWAYSYGILIDATPAAIVTETPIYTRPDLVNKTNKSYSVMEFVVVVDKKDDWVEVAGINKTKKGWIKEENITTKDEDVAVSTLAQKEIFDKNGNIIIDKVENFVENLPYGNSQFESYLNSLIEEAVVDEIEESIMDYEEEGVVVEEDEYYD